MGLPLLLLLAVVAVISSAAYAAPLQGAAYNETLAKKAAAWSSIAYGPPVRTYVRTTRRMRWPPARLNLC